MLLYLIVAWFIAGLFVIRGAVVRNAQARERTLARKLQFLMQQQLPLVEGLEAAADGEPWGTRSLLRSVADRLRRGDSVLDAVQRSWRFCPARLVGVLQAGEASGTLPAVLASLEPQLNKEAAPPVAAQAINGYTFSGLLLGGGAMLGGVYLLSFNLHAIYRDFGVDSLPWQSRVLFDSCRFLAEHVTAVLGLAGILANLMLFRWWHHRNPTRWQWLAWVTDSFVWFCPGVHRLVRNRDLARQLPVLLISLRAGHDLPHALRHASCVDANWHSRRKLRRLATAIEKGKEPQAAIRAAGFPGPVQARLTALRTADDWFLDLEFLAEHYAALEAHWGRVLRAGAAPLLYLVVGVLGGVAAYCIYLPIFYLTEAIVDDLY